MSLLSKALDVVISQESRKVRAPENKKNLADDIPRGTIKPLLEKEFRRLLTIERKRSDRSRRSFLLMLVRTKHPQTRDGKNSLVRAVKPLGGFIRETDIFGWFEADAALGVVFSELGNSALIAAVESIEAKAISSLRRALGENLAGTIQISFYSYPHNWNTPEGDSSFEQVLYPDLTELDARRKSALLLKRAIDVVGSATALSLLSPVFAVLAVIIKLTSTGPVFFRQQRLGRFQVPFEFLKFRSMYVSTDATIHKEYVKKFIAGRAEPNPSNGSRRSVYKLTNDPRVTWIGAFMRRTSLDEIPQFWNVLMGQMSLVGPRPPISYEIEAYDLWHRRRLIEARPGITGPWQVHGRSRTTFDDMVRLDLRYSRICSPMYDLKILFQTPRAVFSGDGAY